MIRNYLRCTLRQWFKHNTYSFKNSFSFTMGIACGAIIFLYLYGELSHERFLRSYRPRAQYHSQRFIEPPSYYADAAKFESSTTNENE